MLYLSATPPEKRPNSETVQAKTPSYPLMNNLLKAVRYILDYVWDKSLKEGNQMEYSLTVPIIVRSIDLLKAVDKIVTTVSGYFG